MLRKQVIRMPSTGLGHIPDEIDIATVATVLVTSETPEHPVDYVFDRHRGPGGTRWIAGEPGEQSLVLAFDPPQVIRRVALEFEEFELARTQELLLAISCDGGSTYREVVRQEYNFSPPGTTFEREEWAIGGKLVTHLQLRIKPDKGNKSCRATMTSLVLQ